VRVMARGVDAVLLAEVYAAGEAPIAAADGRALMHALRVASSHIQAVFIPQIGEMASAIVNFAKDGDIVLCMGAGSVGGVCAQVLKLVETQK
jgi:UDP-N-acetylmuramate--alanine ligase